MIYTSIFLQGCELVEHGVPVGSHEVQQGPPAAVHVSKPYYARPGALDEWLCQVREDNQDFI